MNRTDAEDIAERAGGGRWTLADKAADRFARLIGDKDETRVMKIGVLLL